MIEQSGQWVTMSEAARILELDKSKISRWASQNIIQTRQSPIDRRVRLVNVEEIRNLIATYGG